MRDGLVITMLSVIPKHSTARGMGWLSRIQLPRWMHRLVVRGFVWAYDIRLDECQLGIDDFNSLSEFFIRELKPGLRPIDLSEVSLTSPVDGTVHSFGKIASGKFAQSAERFGDVANLVGEAEDFVEPDPSLLAETYNDGQYIIIYLSPQDYHRVHAHRGGELSVVRYLPGRLWPVFPAATRKIKSLFDRNERLVFGINEENRRTMIAMIGAFGVGRMTSSFLETISNTGRPGTDHRLTDVCVNKGEEIGRFELGSTVIICTESDLEWQVSVGQKVCLGEIIAKFKDC